MKNTVRITLFILLSILPCLSAAQSGKVSLYRVSVDSLVNMMRHSSANTGFYFVEDTSAHDVFTFECDRASFRNRAEQELRRKGYTFSRYGNDIFILKGTGLSTSLTSSFFATDKKTEQQSGDYMEVLTESGETATSQAKTYEIGRKDRVSKEAIYLSGTVTDSRTGEPITGVSVYNEKIKSYSTTDDYGRYKILLPSGLWKISFSGFSLVDISLNVEIYASGNLDVVMKEKVFSLKGAVVSAESINNRRSNKLGVELVRIGRIKQVPSVFGEADVVKILLTLPGVQSVGEASGGFNVRGGATDQNLILFNDGTIYNPMHLFGLFSAFNPDVVSDVELYKSSIPASYGGRISSVLEIRGREGNSKKITGSAGIGLLTARLNLEGPISRKTTFVIGGRTTYSDWLLGLLPSNSGYANGKAFFYDINASVTHKFNRRNTLSAYGYYSRDGFSFSRDTIYRYSNLNASLKWRHDFNDEHSMVLSAGYDQYKYNTIDRSNSINGYNLGFYINQAFAKATFTSTLSDKHKLTYGLHATVYDLNPGSYIPYGDSSLVVSKFLSKENGVEAALFVSDTWTFNDKLSADLGIRYSNFIVVNPVKYYGGPEFRVSGKYLINDQFTLKAGFNSMRQYIHMLSNTTSASPTDTWRLSSADIKPQTGWQAAVALYTTQFDNQVEISLEAYYKQMKNYLDYKSGATLIMNENLVEDVITTRGRAWGSELMIKKPIGKLNGWVSYTYSRTQLKEMEDRGLGTINGGKWYSASYDKPHDIKLVGNYKFTHRFSFSLNVNYSTGRPVTVPVATYQYAGAVRLEYSERNTYRIPDYFRMDAAVNIEPSHYLKKLTYFSITVGVYNVTGRKNAYSIYYKSEGTSIQGYKLCIFGAPIPYLNINVKF